MPTLHVFNPEHDLALASNLSNFTAPHAGRQLRADLGYLPALWAEAGDYVLVEHAEEAQTLYARALHRKFRGFVERHHLSRLDIDAVDPWGWDAALRAFLLRNGVREPLLPTPEQITTIRDLSHRNHSAILLHDLQMPGTTGVSFVQDSLSAISQFLKVYRRIVLKAPWSSSGRGIRFVEGDLDDYQQRWAQHVIDRQGCIMTEPYYNKVKDFGMEFQSDGEGHARYLGLSLFHTTNGAYTGNLLANEEEKEESLTNYLPMDLLHHVRHKVETVAGDMLRARYRGPFGIDMMVVARPDGDGFLLHPCVEINLRRTMGHVALKLQREGVMQIRYTDNHYKLRIRKQ